MKRTASYSVTIMQSKNKQEVWRTFIVRATSKEEAIQIARQQVTYSWKFERASAWLNGQVDEGLPEIIEIGDKLNELC